MAYLFLDESGDLGFDFRKKKTSKIFVVTCLFTENKRPIEKIVKKTHSELRKKYKRKPILYNYVTNILLDRIYSRKIIKTNGKIHLIASKRETNKFLNQNFQNYLNQQVKNRHKAKIEILIRSPHEEKALQAVDFVSWAVFRKYEYQDESYYNLIKSKIIEENPLFP